MVLGGLLAAGDRRYFKRSNLRTAAAEGADSRSAQRA
jgi:hypothetical protein